MVMRKSEPQSLWIEWMESYSKEKLDRKFPSLFYIFPNMKTKGQRPSRRLPDIHQVDTDDWGKEYFRLISLGFPKLVHS